METKSRTKRLGNNRESASSKARSSRGIPKTPPRGKTPYDRIKHLIGILDGPGDLTSNPKYWEEFGT